VKESAPIPAEETERPNIPGYEILRLLGRGGMAVVYEARHLRLNRRVALKILRAGDHATPEQLVRFCTEGEIVAHLRHPHIVQIYEVGTHNKQPYFALELMEGGDLAQALGGKPLAARAAAELVETLARAVDYAHGQGIVHRDLNPANVLLQIADCRSQIDRSAVCNLQSAIPKITDFGLAKHLDQDTRLTKTGFVMGTPSYMAPEQVRGQNERVGRPADVYALGAILYELLTGRPPFQAPTALEVMNQITDLDPVPPSRLFPKVPRDLEVICLKCLKKEPERRYAGAAALVDDLRRFLGGEPIRARPTGRLERARKWARRKPAVAGLLVGIVAAVVVGSGASLYFGLQATWRAHEAEEAKGRALASAAQTKQALGQAQQAKRESDLRAAQLAFREGLAQCEAGAVDRGLFTLVEALRQTPADERDFRRVVCLNLAAWGQQLPVLRHLVGLPMTPGREPQMRFLGSDGGTFATWIEPTGAFRRWDTATGKPLDLPWKLPGDEAVLDISPDRTLLATVVGETGAGNLRELATGKLRASRLQQPRARGGESYYTWLMVSRSGQVAASRSNDGGGAYGLRHFWALASGAKLPVTCQLRHGEGYLLVLDKGGKEILLVFRHERAPREAAGPALAQFWDVVAGRQVSACRPAVGLEPRLSWDGRTALSISGDESWDPHQASEVDGSVRWWETATGRQVGEAWRPRRTAKFTTLSEDSRMLAARCDDQRGRLYDLATGLQRGGDVPLLGDKGKEPGLHLAVSPDAGAVLTGAYDGTFRLWYTRDSQLQTSVATSPRPAGAPAGTLTVNWAVFSPDGKIALVAVEEERPQPGFLIETASGQPLGPALRLGHARHLAFSPDGRLAAMAEDERPGHTDERPGLTGLRVWEAGTGRPRTPVLHAPKLIHGLAFSPDSRTLATAGVAGTFLWDVDKAAIRALLYEGTTAYRLQFRPDGRRLAVAYKSGWTEKGAGFRLWDPRTGQPVGPFVPIKPNPPGRPVLWLSFAADGRTLRVFDAHNGKLHVHNAETGEAAAEPLALEPADQAAFSPDGKWLAGSSTNGNVRLWNAADGTRREPLLKSPYPIASLHFSPDGKVLAAICQDNAVRLCDTATRQPLGPPLLHRSAVLGLTFLSDRSLATVTAQGRTQTWLLPEPVADDPERLQLWIEATGGVKLNGSEVVLLDREEWLQKKQALASRGRELERRFPRASTSGPADAAWHDRRARDAEEDGNTFGMLWHLERLAKLRPDDWRVWARCGRAYRIAGDVDKADKAYRQAAARGGGDVLLDWYRQRAATWMALAKWSEALWYQDRLAAAGADDWQLYADRAEVHGKLGHAAAGDADLAKAVARRPDRDFSERLAEERARQGQWPEAAALLVRATTQPPLDLAACYHCGLACLKAGDRAGYQRLCKRLLQELPARGGNSALVNGVVNLCAVGPGAVVDWQKPLVLMDDRVARLAEAEPKAAPAAQNQLRQMRHATLTMKGAVLYRAGRFAEAVPCLQKGLAVNGGGGTIQGWAFLAMAHHRLGQAAEARRWLAKAARARAQTGGAFSWETVEQELLTREAETLLQKPPPRPRLDKEGIPCDESS
jgi:WD40 repeat protein/tetratricopeptide (TPR) repeat protein